METVGAILAGFLLGTVPVGWLLTHAAGLGDIRAIGSGGMGATNVLRTGRKDIALATLLLDAGKGALAVYVGSRVGPDVAAACGLAAVVGHCHSVWMGGHGGKGVATGLGVLGILAWPAALFSCAVWALVAWRTRISSAASLCACALAPLAVLAADLGTGAGIVPAIAMLLASGDVFWRHRANIQRLRAGTEPRIGRKG